MNIERTDVSRMIGKRIQKFRTQRKLSQEEHLHPKCIPHISAELSVENAARL